MINCEVMTDLETMDVAETAAITSIGAVVFDPYTCTDTPDTLRADGFYRTISLEDNVNRGRSMSPGTVIWWMQQSDDARQALVQNNISLLQAMSDFRRWLQNRPQKITAAWAKSPDFDYSILKSAFKTVRETWPIKFWETRCVRTVESMGFPNGADKPEWRIGEHHNALDDAITQALMIQLCYKRLGLSHT